MSVPHMRASVATYTGIEFFPLAPRFEDIYILDIAHALAMSCRFNGHSRDFYSIAQHSVHVSEWLMKNVGTNATEKLMLAKWGLLHDASEAYIPDMCAPIKPFFPSFRTVESYLLIAIAQRFGLPWPIPDVVKYADKAVLKSEVDSGIMTFCEWWNFGEEHPDANRTIEPMSLDEAEQFFVDEFEYLFGKNELARTYRPGPS